METLGGELGEVLCRSEHAVLCGERCMGGLAGRLGWGWMSIEQRRERDLTRSDSAEARSKRRIRGE